jgi:Flp pilus assembly protein TadG
MFHVNFHRSSRRFAGQRGTALVELALVLPLLMLLLLGMIDFGKAFNSWIDETHLANEGARLAAVNYGVAGCTNSNPDICLAQYVQQSADSPELKSGRTSNKYAPAQNPARVCISYPLNTANSPATQGLIGDPVQVTVSVDYEWLSYLTTRAGLPGGKTPITGKATMRLEQPAPTNAVGTRSCYP